MNLGSKMIIDATKKPRRMGDSGLEIGEKVKQLKSQISGLNSIDRRILDVNLIEEIFLLVKVDSPISNPPSPNCSEIIQKLVTLPELSSLKIIALVSPDVDIHNKESYIWGVFTRFDCERDVIFTENKLVGIAPIYKGVMGIDATWKPGYPEPLVMTDEIVKRVDEKWGRIWKR
jgi:4-hydroxy-3-polyprenylbenzoate decarboxylase